MFYQYRRAVFAGFLFSALALIGGAPAYAASADSPPRIDLSRPNPRPVYPESSKRLGEIGTVVVAVHVNELGRPFDVQLARTSGFARLDQAAVEAVRQWHFSPAIRDGEAVAEWTAVGIQFNMDGVSQIPVSGDTEVAQRERNRVICKKDVGMTGTRLAGGTVCLPKWQWEEKERDARRNVWNSWHSFRQGSSGGQ